MSDEVKKQDELTVAADNTAVNLITERAKRFVGEISDSTELEFDRMISRATAVRKVIRHERSRIFDHLMRFAENTNSAVLVQRVISDALDEVEKAFAEPQIVEPVAQQNNERQSSK